jgi:hypothetical protein
MEEKWHCPVCKSEIIEGPRKRYQDLCEHVSDPNGEPSEKNTLICGNSYCKTHEYEIFWDSDGDIYTNSYHGSSTLNFIDDNNSPFGSRTRRANVEIYKKGLKDKTLLHPGLCLWFLRPYIEFNYTADNQGKVLKVKRSLKFLKKMDKTGSYCLAFYPVWRTWRFLNRQFKTKLRNKNLELAFTKSINRDWPYRTFEFYTKVFYFRKYRQSQN